MSKAPWLLLCLIATPSLFGADADQAAAAINKLGLELHCQLPIKGNLCISPYSIQSALAMTYLGASGNTQAEMAKVLHFPAEKKQLGASFQALRDSLDQAQKTSPKLAMHVANRLFGQQDFAFCQPFLKQVDALFAAPLEKMDFKKQPEPSRKKINQWVEKQTRDRIKDLIPSGGVNEYTRLVLVNAMYFKSAWQKDFEKKNTHKKSFLLNEATAVAVPMMAIHWDYRYLNSQDFQSVALPYAGNELHLLVILPKAVDGLAKLEASLTHKKLLECCNAGERKIQLEMPKFKLISAAMPLGDVLKHMGMKTAFDEPARSADFSEMAPITPSSYLAISHVFHKTFMELNEEGTEAAASTAVVMEPFGAAPSPPQKPIVLKVNRPFLFAIQHRASGACLFLGRVVDPR
jgi:serpin B